MTIRTTQRAMRRTNRDRRGEPDWLWKAKGTCESATDAELHSLLEYVSDILTDRIEENQRALEELARR